MLVLPQKSIYLFVYLVCPCKTLVVSPVRIRLRGYRIHLLLRKVSVYYLACLLEKYIIKRAVRFASGAFAVAFLAVCVLAGYPYRQLPARIKKYPLQPPPFFL